MRHFSPIIGYTRALFRDKTLWSYSNSAAMASKAATGSSASVMGRPTTMCDAPFAKAWAGVATRLWSPRAAPAGARRG